MGMIMKNTLERTIKSKMKEIFPKDKEEVHMNLEVPTFVNTRKDDCILSKKYTTKEEGLIMKRLNKKIVTINNTIFSVFLMGILFWFIGDGLFGRLGGIVVTVIVTTIISLLTVRKYQLKNKKLQLILKARR